MGRRILYVENGLGLGGATRCMHELVRGAAHAGFEPFVAISYDDPELASLIDVDHRIELSRFRRIGANSRTVSRTGRTGRDLGRRFAGSTLNLVNSVTKDMPLTRFLCGEIRRLNIELVHTNNGLLANRAEIEAAHRARVPVIAHQRGWEWPCPTTRVLARKVSRIVAISDAVKEDLSRAGAPAQAVTRIYDGVDVAHFTVNAERRSAARRELGFDDQTVVIGFPASHLTWKGHRVFLQAFERVSGEGAKVRALLAGARPAHAERMNPEPEEVARRLHIANRIVWLGQLPDPLAAYSACDLVVHASTEPEPLGLTVLEAMSCGLPVVASQAGGPAETVLDGRTGLLYPAGDVEALSARLERLIGDPTLRQEMGRAGRQRVVRSFAMDASGRGLFEMYRELLEPDCLPNSGEESWPCELSHS